MACDESSGVAGYMKHRNVARLHQYFRGYDTVMGPEDTGHPQANFCQLPAGMGDGRRLSPPVSMWSGEVSLVYRKDRS